MHIAKKGLRVLGIAESFEGRDHSILAGVVMRKDLLIDGVSLASITVGGMDATDAVIRIFHDLGRKDINLIMLSGCVIAWFNIIETEKVWEATKTPLIVVTYEDSEGLEEDICRHFPGDERRLEAYRRLGSRIPADLHTGYRIFIRGRGISEDDARRVCDAFTKDGKVPEPLRVARIMARAAMRYRHGISGESSQ